MNSIPVHKGVKVHWACSTTGASGVGTFSMQSRDHSRTSDSEAVMDGTGFTVNKTYYNFSEQATLEIIPTTTGPGGNLTPTIPEPSDVLTLSDTVYTQIAGTSWIVENVSTRSSNTSAMRVTVSLTRYPLITS